MTRNTEFKTAGSNFGETIKQSFRMMAGKDVPNYSLVFLDPTKHHDRGETKNVVVPYMVMGRGASCNIQYGEEYNTVSRQHASIQMEANGCLLIHNPEATNPTLVDGKPINGFHQLSSGDEIQLSYEGPRVRFLADRQQQSRTSTMGFTRRMSMAMGQALRPYRRALMILGILLLGAIGYSVWGSMEIGRLKSKHETLLLDIGESEQKIAHQEAELASLQNNETRNVDRINSISASLNNERQRNASLRGEIGAIQRRLNSNGEEFNTGSNANGPYSTGNADYPAGDTFVSGTLSSKELEQIESNIYYIQVEDFDFFSPDPYSLKEPEDRVGKVFLEWSGTGFLTSDGKFITARHVLEPWKYLSSDCSELDLINSFIVNGGRVEIKYSATSSRGGHSFTFTNKNLVSDESADKLSPPYTCGEYTFVSKAAQNQTTDWIYLNIGNKKSNLVFDRTLSGQLERGERLYILGYPLGLHLQPSFSTSELNPLYSEATVSQKGIVNGQLNVTHNAFVGGNSGGPVFARRGNEYRVVGIVSAGINQIGIVVPTANIW